VYVYVCVCVRDCTFERERTEELDELRASNCACYTKGFLESSGCRTRALQTSAYTKKSPIYTTLKEPYIHNTQKSPIYTTLKRALHTPVHMYVHTLENSGYRPRLTCSWYKLEKDLSSELMVQIKQKTGCGVQTPHPRSFLGGYMTLYMYDTLYHTLYV